MKKEYTAEEYRTYFAGKIKLLATELNNILMGLPESNVIFTSETFEGRTMRFEISSAKKIEREFTDYVPVDYRNNFNGEPLLFVLIYTEYGVFSKAWISTNGFVAFEKGDDSIPFHELINLRYFSGLFGNFEKSFKLFYKVFSKINLETPRVRQSLTVKMKNKSKYDFYANIYQYTIVILPEWYERTEEENEKIEMYCSLELQRFIFSKKNITIRFVSDHNKRKTDEQLFDSLKCRIIKNSKNITEINSDDDDDDDEPF